jgi:hypothetical protein
MQTVDRHGGGSHFVRPDRVYRTGVLTSTMGYDPGADVQSVASSFTQYPMDLRVPSGLSGLGSYLGAAGNVGLIEKLRTKFAQWRAKKDIQRAGMPPQAAAAAFMAARGHGRQYMPGGAYGQVGEQYSPQLIAKEQMVAHLTSGGTGLPPAFAEAQAATSWRNWSSPWWNAR